MNTKWLFDAQWSNELLWKEIPEVRKFMNFVKQGQWAQMKAKTGEDQGKQVNWLHILRPKPEL